MNLKEKRQGASSNAVLGRLRFWGLAVAVLLLLAGSIAAHAEEKKQTGGWKLSPAAVSVLESNALKRLARQDPDEAIRRLDELRAAAASSEIDLAIAEVALRAGLQAPSGEAVGLLLRAASETYPPAPESEGDSESARIHARAVEGLIVALQQPGASVPDETALETNGPLADWELTWLNADEKWTPATHEFVPATHYRTVKTKLEASRPGIGVPVVAWRKEGVPDPNVPEGGIFPIYVYSYPLTAVFELDEEAGEPVRRARVRLIDPRLHDTYSLADVEHPLAFDLGAQIAALIQEIDLVFAKKGALHSGKYLTKVGVYPLEPARADKIPVVMIHGLTASIRTWVAAYEAFIADPELRRRYQFSLFTYPTGLPFPYSATLLRRALVQMLGQPAPGEETPLHQRTVLIGHSMGGLLARLQVTSSGEMLWYAVFKDSPEELEVSPRDREFVREILIFEPLPFVERVIFCSTPHRGSEMAASRIGKIGISMIKLPDELQEVGKGIVTADPDAYTGKAAERQKFPDGVQSLQPDHDVILALDNLSIDDRVTYHSIVGDRGKGNSPESSDGVVGYWSSTLDGAASETIVPSDHSSHRSPDGIAELVRILHLHLDDD